jgi:hypothetical protein
MFKKKRNDGEWKAQMFFFLFNFKNVHIEKSLFIKNEEE